MLKCRIKCFRGLITNTEKKPKGTFSSNPETRLVTGIKSIVTNYEEFFFTLNVVSLGWFENKKKFPEWESKFILGIHRFPPCPL